MVLDLLLAASSFLAPQDPPAVPVLEIALAPRSPDASGGLRWSPKGAAVPLQVVDGALVGDFALGGAALPSVAVRLSQSDGSEHIDVFEIDLDRDGAFQAGERLTTTPRETRGKWWSSFEATVPIPMPLDAAGQPVPPRAYPIAFWFVSDPVEPDAAPALRWSRRGWHQGEFELGGARAFALITEMAMDGVFDQRDSWSLARDEAALRSAASRSLESHVWLDGLAYRAVAIDPNGRSLRIELFDPGITEAEEKARDDLRAADRAAPRAAAPVAFGTDFTAALARAGVEQKRILVDFETSWCGPCQEMNRLVYTAKPVFDAAADVVAVKLDGDVERDLVKRFKVGAYPTILLLAADGTELRRAVGYRGVAQMVEFLRAEAGR